MFDENRRHDWSLILAHCGAGHSFAQCKERFEFSAQSCYKAIACGRLQLSDHGYRILKSRGTGNPVYDWAAVQRYYDEGNSYEGAEKVRFLRGFVL